MRKLFILLWGVVIMQNPLFAQNWLWAKSSFSTYGNVGKSVVVSKVGNIYCSGFFTQYITVDSVTLIGGSANFNNNRFICKYSADGALLKSTVAYSGNSSTNYLSMGPLSSDNAGNIYTNMGVNGLITVDTIQVLDDNAGLWAKFNADLSCIYVQSVWGNSYQVNAFLSTSPDNNNSSYVVGAVNDSIAHLDTFNIYGPQCFLAKLDTAGRCLNVKQTHGGSSGISKCIYNNDYLYLLGVMDSCFVFDTVTICNPAINTRAFFLAKTDTMGSVKWLSPIPVKGTYTSINAYAMDGDGNTYLTGTVDTFIAFGTQTLYCSASGGVDMFVAKCDSNGTFVWAKQLDASNAAAAESISTDQAGNSYVLGGFKGTVILGNDTVISQSARMLIIRYDKFGNIMEYKTGPNAGGWAVATDSAGNAIVTGQTHGSNTYFDSIQLNCGNTDGGFFIAKLSAITGTSNALPRMLQEESLEIYANPNRGMFTIVVPKDLNNAGSGQLRIYDNTGTEVKNELVDISGNKIQVELGTVQKGLYTVTLTSGRQFTGRVVIQ